MMKGSGALVASVIAASSVALASSSSPGHCDSHPHHVARKESTNDDLGDTEKFAPRFDGLRFIETLVTAHR